MKRINNTETILVMMTGFVMLGCITHSSVFIIISIVSGFVSLLSDTLADGIVALWLKISHIIGAIIGRVLLTFIFFLFLFPISLLARFLGKVSIQKKAKLESYWSQRNHLYRKDDFENPW